MENTLILISGSSDSDQEAVFLRFLILSEGIKIDCCKKLESIEINGDIGMKLGWQGFYNVNKYW